MATASIIESEAETPLIEPDKHYEVVNGRIVKEPPLGVPEMEIAAVLDQNMGPYARSNRLGRVIFETLFILRRSPRLRRRPDLAFVSIEKWPLNRPLPPGNAWDVIPDLAVEIISPTDLARDMMAKIEEYFEAGVRLLWVFYPEQRKIYVYESPESIRVLCSVDELDGGIVLPGFLLPVSTVFGPVEAEPSPTS